MKEQKMGMVVNSIAYRAGRRLGDVTIDDISEVVKESDTFESDFDQVAVEQLYELRRHLLKLRNAAVPMDDICNQLIRFHENLVPKELRAYVRDVQDHAHQIMTITDDMREMLTNAMH